MEADVYVALRIGNGIETGEDKVEIGFSYHTLQVVAETVDIGL